MKRLPAARRETAGAAAPDPAQHVPAGTAAAIPAGRQAERQLAEDRAREGKVERACREGDIPPSMQTWAPGLGRSNEAAFDRFLARVGPVFAGLFREIACRPPTRPAAGEGEAAHDPAARIAARARTETRRPGPNGPRPPRPDGASGPCAAAPRIAAGPAQPQAPRRPTCPRPADAAPACPCRAQGRGARARAGRRLPDRLSRRAALPPEAPEARAQGGGGDRRCGTRPPRRRRGSPATARTPRQSPGRAHAGPAGHPSRPGIARRLRASDVSVRSRLRNRRHEDPPP